MLANCSPLFVYSISFLCILINYTQRLTPVYEFVGWANSRFSKFIRQFSAEITMNFRLDVKIFKLNANSVYADLFMPIIRYIYTDILAI